MQGYPTVLFMYADAYGTIKAAGKYAGPRTAKHIVAWALQKVQALAMERIGEQADVPLGPATATSEDSGEAVQEEEVFEEERGGESGVEGGGDFYANTGALALS